MNVKTFVWVRYVGAASNGMLKCFKASRYLLLFPSNKNRPFSKALKFTKWTTIRWHEDKFHLFAHWGCCKGNVTGKLVILSYDHSMCVSFGIHVEQIIYLLATIFYHFCDSLSLSRTHRHTRLATQRNYYYYVRCHINYVGDFLVRDSGYCLLTAVTLNSEAVFLAGRGLVCSTGLLIINSWLFANGETEAKEEN